MRLGIITGSGAYTLPELEGASERTVQTRFGACELTVGRWRDVEVAHVTRHGAGHARLSSHVNHRANILALRELGADAVIGVTICGAVDAALELGTLVVFDDLHFLANRLPDGSICSLHDRPGGAGRGHWVYERPFSEPLRRALLDGAAAAELGARDGGCYGHVDGPRFNTRAEIRMLAACGVSAVSQTAGPETVLCGEAGLPYALLGYLTDYANGVGAEPTPVSELTRLMGLSAGAFSATLAQALRLLPGEPIAPTGIQLSWP
ncbi:MAG TPA: MTAP family purine nucleoside phosphorylase [Solirubrobacteraceae bacterium]|jgi:purine nucleoside phosphorylase|nr:MTAP family purine nucleoside phosphorylase [Solirubrobacteraceae bacterium]